MNKFLTELKRGEVRTWVMLLTTIVVSAMWFTAAYHKIPDSNKEIFSNMSNMIVTTWIGAMAYYFGSSKGETDANKKPMPAGVNVEQTDQVNVSTEK